MSLTVDALLQILKKAKQDFSGETPVVLTMNPSGTIQGQLDRVHVTTNAEGAPVLAIYSLQARKYRLKGS